jgi:hypothetical protein
MQEKDPDTLQLRDEMDTEWVKRWRKATAKEKKKMTDLKLTFTTSPDIAPDQKIKQKSSV